MSVICSNDGWTGILCHGFESAVGVISKEILQYYNKILNKSFVFVVGLKRLCSKHEQVSLKRKETLSVWVEPISKC